jgi:hypothetical protein
VDCHGHVVSYSNGFSQRVTQHVSNRFHDIVAHRLVFNVFDADRITNNLAVALRDAVVLVVDLCQLLFVWQPVA